MQRKSTMTNTLLTNKASISLISGIIFITNYFYVSECLFFLFSVVKTSYMVFDLHLTEDFIDVLLKSFKATLPHMSRFSPLHLSIGILSVFSVIKRINFITLTVHGHTVCWILLYSEWLHLALLVRFMAVRFLNCSMSWLAASIFLSR